MLARLRENWKALSNIRTAKRDGFKLQDSRAALHLQPHSRIQVSSLPEAGAIEDIRLLRGALQMHFCM
jgi:hypothetical protein